MIQHMLELVLGNFYINLKLNKMMVNMMKIAQVYFKGYVNTISLWSDSPPPVYANWLQMEKPTNLFHDTLEIMT